MGLSRKEFICSAALAAGSHVVFARPEARPLMRLGMIADVHLETGETGKAVQNCLCFEPALRYFDEDGHMLYDTVQDGRYINNFGEVI